MINQNKNSRDAKAPPQPIKPVGRPSRSGPFVKSKNAVVQQNIKYPTAPPVYRPPPVTKDVQAKMRPAGPPVYRPQPQPKVLQKKLSTMRTPTNPKLVCQSDPGAGVQLKIRPVAPPVYRPSLVPRVLQTKQTGLPMLTARTSAVATAPRIGMGAAALQPRRPAMQLKVFKAPMPPLASRSASIQRALSKPTMQGEAEVVARFLAALEKEEEEERQAFLRELEQEKVKPAPKQLVKKKKKIKAPQVDKEAQRKKEEKEKEFAARELERQKEREKELQAAAVRWYDVLTRNNAAPFVFGLINERYISLAPPHRCFLSSYEKDNFGNRKDNRFGLSRKIILTSSLRDAYLAKYHAVPDACVLHLHCAGDGSVLSFSIKYLALEQQAGNNVVFPDLYKPKAADYVGDIDGNNVNAKVGQFT
jgi:hypothetical protein